MMPADPLDHRPESGFRRSPGHGPPPPSGGDQVFCALSWGDGSPPQTFADAHKRLANTGDFWHEWISRGKFPDHPVAHLPPAVGVDPEGSHLRALPEPCWLRPPRRFRRPRRERNYDYRYSWLRDSTFMLWGCTTGVGPGGQRLFLLLVGPGRAEPGLQIMYGIGGERELNEIPLDHLSGYEGLARCALATGRGISASTTRGESSSTRCTFTAGSREMTR